MTIVWKNNPTEREKQFGRWIGHAGYAQLPSKGAEPWVRKGKTYMDAHFTEGITVDHVAAFLNVHRSYLTRKFTEVYRVPPKQYLHRLRMEHAAELLRRTSMSVADIADTLHYSDAFSFSRAYKNYHRHAPSLARCSSTK